MGWWLVIVGCSWFDPALGPLALEPSSVRSGGAVEVVGEGLRPLPAGRIEPSQGPMVPVVLRDDGQVHFRVPELSPGTAFLVLQRGDNEARVAFEVLAPPSEVPCARKYAARTEVSLSAGIAAVVRYWPNGTEDRVSTPLERIAGIEVSTHEDPDGGAPCWAIHLRRDDGVRVLFEDGHRVLIPRAETLARLMDLPLAQPGVERPVSP